MSANDDLDVLIGDLQAEAARRRAEPGFPLDEEAQLGVQLDGQAPRPSAPKLDRLADAAASLVSSPAVPTGRAAKMAATAVIGPLQGQVSALGRIMANALRIASDRLTDLDARLERIEYPGRPSRSSVPARTGSHPHRDGSTELSQWEPAVSDGDTHQWVERVRSDLPERPGRVLYCGADAETAVAALRVEGLDAYGLTPAGDPYLSHPDVRPGDLLQHLRSAGELSLGAAIVAGSTRTVDPDRLGELAQDLARVARIVVVMCEAPWWWRERVGSEQADMAWSRPLSAETWVAALHRAGLDGSVDYSEGAVSYRVVARQR